MKTKLFTVALALTLVLAACSSTPVSPEIIEITRVITPTPLSGSDVTPEPGVTVGEEPVTAEEQPVHAPELTLPIDLPPAPTGEQPAAKVDCAGNGVPNPNAIVILVLGLDARPERDEYNTDVILLACVDPDAHTVSMLSIPRDTYVYISGWREHRINQAVRVGKDEAKRKGLSGQAAIDAGVMKLRETIEFHYGVHVHYYVMVDIAGLAWVVDQIGTDVNGVRGIDIVADCPVLEIFPDVPPGTNDVIPPDQLATVPIGKIDIPGAGVYHLDGKHVLWYARARKAGNGGDTDRNLRHQRILRGLMAAIIEQGLVSQLPALWSGATQYVTTDLTLNDALYLSQVARDLRMRMGGLNANTAAVGGKTIHWEWTDEAGQHMLDTNEFWFTRESAQAYIRQQFAAFPEAEPEFIPRVDIVDGSGHLDWYLVAADKLDTAGFSVRELSASSTHLTESRITVFGNGDRLVDLVDLFQVPQDNVLWLQNKGDGEVDFQVEVGRNWDACKSNIARYRQP